MIDRPAPAHWIRANHVTRIPRRHVVIDTEARQADTDRGKVQTFRLAVGAFDYQTKAGRPWQSTPLQRFSTPRSLWEWVDGCTLAGRRTVVVAHNLAYDLRIADAFTHLPALGYELEMIRLDGGAAWCQWRRGNRALVMVDTVSWFGCSLDRIGALLRLTKPALPDFDGTDAAWFDRCEADVTILRRAWRMVLDWIEAGDLGNWKPTGAGQGWAFLRHRHMTHKILHHAVGHVAAIEREAAWTGRCEAWQWGRLPAGEWTEWDFASAYARVAEDCALPVRLVGHLGPKHARAAVDGVDGTAALVHCRVSTSVPSVPCRGSDGILWPVGTFSSWLWDHEARMAVAAGADVTCVEGWRYATAPALKQWATAVLDMIDADPRRLHPLLRLVVKGWSRTTIGRFGAQWSTWDHYGDAAGDDCTLWRGNRPAGDGDMRYIMIGGRCLAESERADAPDSAVHVMSWIMAECRVRLWHAMGVAGFGNVAYVDTDALYVNAAGSDRLAGAGLPGLRPKSRWRTVEVLGPRQLVLKGKLKASGIPLTATRSGRRSWDAEVWRSLPASLRAGEMDSVVVRPRRFVLSGVDRRRRHASGGVTAPFAVDL